MTFFVTPFPGIPQKWKITLKNAHFSDFWAVNQIQPPIIVLLLHKKVAVSYMHILSKKMLYRNLVFAPKMTQKYLFSPVLTTFSLNTGMKILPPSLPRYLKASIVIVVSCSGM